MTTLHLLTPHFRMILIKEMSKQTQLFGNQKLRFKIMKIFYQRLIEENT